MKNCMSNLWDTVEIRCLNHEDPPLMKIMQNEQIVKTPFYMCEDHEKCANRMNLDDYQDMVLHFFHELAENPYENFTNCSFTFRGRRHSYRVKVLLHERNKIILGVKNRTILGGR